jgi:small conductance mechanosensitive channel
MAEVFTHWTDVALITALRVIVILLIALVLNRLLRAVTRRLVRLAATETRAALLREQQTRTLAGILYSGGNAIIFAGAMVTVLAELGLNITPIAAAAGLASLAVGFGAQHLVRDLINGFFIVFEDQYVVGDVVQIGTVTGRVEHLTLRRTVVRDAQGALCTVPNGEIRQVANLSRDWNQIFVDASVAHEAAVERALAVLEKVAAEMRADEAWAATLVDGPRVLGVEALSAIGITLRMQVRSVPGRQYDVARELRRRIKLAFEQERIASSGVQHVELIKPKEPSAI